MLAAAPINRAMIDGLSRTGVSVIALADRMDAGELFAQAERSLPDLWANVARGELSGLKVWLNESVHALGKRYRPGELLEVVTGERLDVKPFVHYLQKKFTSIYEL